MPGIEDLPHIVRLLEDDSPVVQAALKEALAEFGDGLYDDLRAADIVLGGAERDSLEKLRPGGRPGREFDENWEQWLTGQAGEPDLERGMGLISWLVRGDRGAPAALARRLDRLEEEYRERLSELEHVTAVHSLAEFLFKIEGFEGDEDDYYLPRNSDMLSVLERRKGNPISLACLLILVGKRCGLDINACNFPGHFMARVELEGKVFLIDCFNGGRFVPAEDLRERVANAADFIEADAGGDAVVRRALLNLVNAYVLLGDQARADEFKRLVDRF